MSRAAISFDGECARVQRINGEDRPFAVIADGMHGDELAVWNVSEQFAPVLARILGLRFLG